jgi:uncharacterized protein
MNKDWEEATKQGDLEKVRLLFDQGMDINSRDEHGQTALMNAAHAGQLELVRLLIDVGADIHIRSSRSFRSITALSLAEGGGHEEIAVLLKRKGATGGDMLENNAHER